MNTKKHFLEAAVKYRAEAQRSVAPCAITGDWSNYERSIAEARTYEWLASLHPQTRASWVRRNWGSK